MIMSNTKNMGNYKRVIRCGNGLRGMRLNMRKLSIHRLIRAKFLNLFRVLKKWKKSFGSLRKSLTYRGSNRSTKSSHSHSHSRLIIIAPNNNNINDQKILKSESRVRSLARTNSFYSEAIADCLEFIKRNSLSLDHHPISSPSVRF